MSILRTLAGRVSTSEKLEREPGADSMSTVNALLPKVNDSARTCVWPVADALQVATSQRFGRGHVLRFGRRL